MPVKRGLERVASLYAIMERMRSIEVQAAHGAVKDVLCSSAIAAAIRASQIEDGRDALATGRRDAWQVAETTCGVIDRRMERLQQVRTEREAALAEASTIHRASRLEMEQMERMVEKIRAQALVNRSRRAQGDADDRFASRSAWLEMQRVQGFE